MFRVTKPTLSAPTLDEILLAAIEELGGPALVLDARLAVLHATADAERVMGSPVTRGVSVVKLLCGEGEQRPIAEGLAAGQAVNGSVVRPMPDGTVRLLHLRASPIVRDSRRIGWLVLLDDEAGDRVDGEETAVLFHGMWTRDPGMKRIFHIVERAARRDVSVLIRGPTGAGKELVARAIHELSPRHDGPFRAVNCAALPPNLLESELFGHVKGAFTGAVKDNPGIFRAAHQGTLFLDEVAEMPLDLQAKLLRVLETRTVIPVGGIDPIPVDVRVVAATHQSLRDAVDRGRFRSDLMYRLRVVPIFLPALADRHGDVELITEKLIEELNSQGGRRVARIARGALDALTSYRWPGNVRELRNALEYAYVIGDGAVLHETDLPSEVAGSLVEGGASINVSPPADEREPPEARRIRMALERSGGNRERAAQVLGVSRVTLWRRMKTLGMLTADEAAPATE